MLLEVLLEYPRRVTLSSFCMLMAAILEGLGITAMLPLLGFVIDRDGASPAENQITEFFDNIFNVLGTAPSLEGLLIFIVIMFIAKMLLTLLATYHISHAQAAVTAETRVKLLDALLRSQWGFFLTQTTGQVANILGQEVQRSSRAYQVTCSIISKTLQCSVYLVGAAIISWEITLSAIVAGLVMLVLLGGLVRRTKELGQSRTELMKFFTHDLVDSLNGMKPLKAMGVIELCEPKLNEYIWRLKLITAKSTFVMRGMGVFQETLRVMAVILLAYVVLGYNETTLEEMLVIAVMFLRSTQAVGEMQGLWQVAAGIEYPYHYLKGFLDDALSHQEKTDGHLPPTLSHEIKFNNVSFSYKDTNVLSGINLSIPAKGFTCFVGPSGSGKTTLIDLITGLRSPVTGQILVDGVSIENLDIFAWRQMIGYVPQDTFLFSGSIYENVSLNDESIDREDVKNALIEADVWSFVTTLPNAMDSMVGERGGWLSGGQRQRIAIARALVRRPQLLILDEATSALDEESEKSIAETLSHIAKNISVVGITHRSGLVNIADQTWQAVSGTFERV